MAAPNRELILQRNQYVLDLSRPEVEEFVYNTVAGLLKKHSGIRYVKWDHNAFGRQWPDLRHWLVTRARFPTGTTQLITGFSPGCAGNFRL